MRIALPLTAFVLATSPASAQQVAPIPAPNPVIVVDPPRDVPAFERVCRDRIHVVRDERGLPHLDRENSTADEALLIAAVDRRIDGCSVMVMRNNLADVRPLPTMQGEPRMQKIPGQ